MHKLLLAALLLCSSLAFAGASKLELFGGGQYTHLDPNFNLTGWNAAATVNLKGWLGATADFSGVYHSGLKFHTYAVGPELRANLPLIKPFVHGLIGGARSTQSGISESGLIGMVGGGADLGGRSVVFRIVQVDWIATRFSTFTNSSSKNFRGSAGIVIRF